MVPEWGGRAMVIAQTFDRIVASLGTDVVSYWKFQVPAGATVRAEKGVQNATITGAHERSIETIVDLDRRADGDPADGTVIAWPGTDGAYAEAPHNALHKTTQGTIIAYFQCDSLDEKSTIVAFNANNAAGE